MKRWQSLGIVIVGISLVLAGCGEKGPDLIPVSGTVTLDSKPVEGATVVFNPQGSSLAAEGKTDAQGKFTLKTQGKPGAVVGEHLVTVARLTGGEKKDAAMSEDEAKKATMQMMDPEKMKKMQEEGVKSDLPEKYTDPKKSGLTAKVEAGKPNTFTFDMKTE